MYAERLPDESLVSGFENLLNDQNMADLRLPNMTKFAGRCMAARWKSASRRQWPVAAAGRGFELLSAYLEDFTFQLQNFRIKRASGADGQEWGYNPAEWGKYLAGLSFPRAGKALKKSIEI